MNPNAEISKKHLSCPNCGEDLNVHEFDEQECWSCGWPNAQEDEDGDNTNMHTDSNLNARKQHRNTG